MTWKPNYAYFPTSHLDGLSFLLRLLSRPNNTKPLETHCRTAACSPPTCLHRVNVMSLSFLRIQYNMIFHRSLIKCNTTTPNSKFISNFGIWIYFSCNLFTRVTCAIWNIMNSDFWITGIFVGFWNLEYEAIFTFTKRPINMLTGMMIFIFSVCFWISRMLVLTLHFTILLPMRMENLLGSVLIFSVFPFSSLSYRRSRALNKVNWVTKIKTKKIQKSNAFLCKILNFP